MVIPFVFRYGKPIEVVVSDFDGTITAPEEVEWPCEAFAEAYAECEVRRNLRKGDGDVRERIRALERACDLRRQTSFRPEMLDAFLELGVNLPVYVVSDREAAEVQKYMGVLGDRAETLRSRVRGGVRKFATSTEPGCLRRHTEFSSPCQRTHLPNPCYVDALRSIMDDVRDGMPWDRLLVIGDVAEVDLLTPVEMGACGLLIQGPSTPEYELEWAERHSRVQVIHSLDEVSVALDL